MSMVRAWWGQPTVLSLLHARNLFKPKPFKESFLPRGVKDNAEAEVERYNQILADHPVDLQILGIGRNGHIGFNEPGTPFDSQTHLVELDKSTIEANARFFDKIEDVPTQAISMGIKNILDAKSSPLFALRWVEKQKLLLEPCLVQWLRVASK